jgi:hypothetical protein
MQLPIVKAICILHNFVPEREGPDPNYLSIETVQSHSQPAQHHFSTHAQTVREKFLNYFNSVGSVPWQNEYALPEHILQRHNTTEY